MVQWLQFVVCCQLLNGRDVRHEPRGLACRGGRHASGRYVVQRRQLSVHLVVLAQQWIRAKLQQVVRIRVVETCAVMAALGVGVLHPLAGRLSTECRNVLSALVVDVRPIGSHRAHLAGCI